MPPASISNTIIRASAGSGKTHALVQRLVRLLALDVKPEAIVALTFTRKAAGEFFARLLQRLADFVDHPETAVAYTPELGRDTREKCLHLLRLLLAQMDRMRLGTLDSFFAAMVQSLPFELGLTGMGALMSPEEERQAHEEVLDAVLVDLMRPENSAAKAELVEAWKLASLGHESSRPADDISRWMEELHEWYLEQPDTRVWGHSARIWPHEDAPILRVGEDAGALRKELQDSIIIDAFRDKTAEARWQAFFDDLEHHQPGTPLTEGLKYMLDAKRGDAQLLARGQGVWKIGRAKEVSLGERASLLLHRALQVVVGRELHAACMRTQGRSRLVGLYEKAYQRHVRSAGRLCFSDLALLLSGRLDPGGSSDWQERWPQLRSDMEYRLDARYDHWLFDEFQDTSRRQWRVFENIVDEVLQDAEARRTFFAVGDLKQSIYLWREAEPELFLGVEERYRKHRMEFGSLRVSWRSTPEVLQMVNDTFGNERALSALLPGAMEWWRFEPHESAPKLAGQHGHAAFLSVRDREEKQDALVALLRQINPLARGLSCAVLVRKNEVARALAVRLRSDLACEVVCESEQAVATDNPVTLALLSVIQLGAHPSDTLAWQHLRMTPLQEWLEKQQVTKAILGSEVRRELRRGGFLALAETWSARLRECAGGLDAFSDWRVRQFLELAASFDASGSRDIDAFLRFARDHRAAGPGDTRALQVMTIHKSKGLEFDLVILPDLQVTVLDDARRQQLLWDRDESGELTWLLDRPVSAIVEWDGRLTRDVERLEARAAFEGLCRLYVAMTRAKQGLYLLHHRDGRTATRSEAGLLESVLSHDLENEGEGNEASTLYAVEDAPELACIYEAGARDWYERCPLRSEPSGVLVPEFLTAQGGSLSLPELLRATGGVITRRTPSAEEQHKVRGRDLFSARREAGRQMGVLVHGLFSEVAWLDRLTLEQVETHWENTRWAAMAGYDEAKTAVLRCLDSAAVRPWFMEFPQDTGRVTTGLAKVEKGRSGGAATEKNTAAEQLSFFGDLEAKLEASPISANGRVSREVWRERTFDLLLNGQWVSGQMDRVVIEREVGGQVIAAMILDFKTDAVASAEDRKIRARGYAPQLQLYREAVRRLTGLAEDKVATLLVFTGTGEVESAG